MSQNPLAFTANNPSGASSHGFLDGTGALMTFPRHGKYYEGTYRGASGWAANQALATTSAGLATTYTGICLSNPAGSGKNLVVQKVSAILDVAPSTVTGVGLIVGYSAAGIVTHTTPLTPYNALIGTSAAGLVGLADAACTLVGTPLWRQFLAETPTATTLVSYGSDIDGEIVLPPGAYMAIGTTIASPASSFFGSISWEELSTTNG